MSAPLRRIGLFDPLENVLVPP